MPTLPTQPVRRAARRPAARVLGLAVLLAFLGTTTPSSAQDPAALRLFQEAQRRAAEGDATAALEDLVLLVRQFPDDDLAAKALLEMVVLRRDTGDERGAEVALDKLLTDYARTVEAAEGFLEQGEMAVSAAREPADLEEARAEFRRVPLLFGVDAYPRLDARARARVRSAELGLLLGDVQGAAAELLAAVEDEPPSPWTGRARLLLGRTLLGGDDPVAGMEILQRLASDASGAEATETGEPSAARAAAPSASSAADRGRARRLLSWAHRHILRPRAGQERWHDTRRFPEGLSLRAPTGVAASEDGQVLVIDRRQSLAVLASPDDEALQTRQLDDPIRPGFTGDVPYVVTEEQVVLPFDGQRLAFLEPRSGRESALDDLRAAVRGPFGDWFLLARGWKSVLHYTGPRRGQQILTGLRADPVDLERDPLGRMVMLDEDEDRVVRVGVDRRRQDVLVRGDWRRPEALAIDSMGQLYVLDRGRKQVLVYSDDGRLLSTIGPRLGGGVELRSPEDVAVDGSGRLYIADSDLPFVAVLD